MDSCPKAITLFLEQSEGFISTQEEAEQIKWGVSLVTCPEEHLLGSPVGSAMVISNPVLWVIHMSSDRKLQSRIAAWLPASRHLTQLLAS